MKKLFFCAAIVFTMASAFSQNWCPPGAKWHINRGGPFSFVTTGTDGVIEMSYTTNTTVIGIPCKRLDAVFSGVKLLGNPSGANITYTYGTFYTYENNNVIFLYNGTNAFDTLVNFNALPGEKWLKTRSTQSFCIERPVVTVTDTSHVTINGFYLRQIKTLDSAKVTNWTWSGTNTYTYVFTYTETTTFVERILFPGYYYQNLFPADCADAPDTAASDGPPANYLRCYEDNAFPVYKVNSPFWSGASCSWTGINETISNNNINLSLYPNPNDGCFQVDIQQATDIWIYNMFGETVYYGTYSDPGKRTVDVAHLSPGAYILKAKTAEGNGQMKLIRQ